MCICWSSRNHFEKNIFIKYKLDGISTHFMCLNSDKNANIFFFGKTRHHITRIFIASPLFSYWSYIWFAYVHNVICMACKQPYIFERTHARIHIQINHLLSLSINNFCGVKISQILSHNRCVVHQLMFGVLLWGVSIWWAVVIGRRIAFLLKASQKY